MPRTYKKKMALLIAAHNEELVIEKTLQSAIHAGMKPANIYVVNDNSTDKTTICARRLLPKDNIHEVKRSGKGLALHKATKKYQLTQKYQWIHIADADGAFAPNYFTTFRRELRTKNAAATGYVKSLPGKNVSQYRVFEYTVGMELHRRLQSMLNVIPVIPGPTSCFRADVLEKVDFTNHSLTEDFDVTLQLYRQKLGKIQFIKHAYAYTQDPKTVSDYIKQVSRWNRGVMQGMIKHRIGTKINSIDLYLVFSLLLNLLLFVNYAVWVPYFALTTMDGGSGFLAVTFLFDVILTLLITLLVAFRSRRFDVLSGFPYVYFIKWLSLGIFIKAFVEVVILRRYRITDGIWATGQRRYIA